MQIQTVDGPFAALSMALKDAGVQAKRCGNVKLRPPIKPDGDPVA